jgi:hypothetical protein
VILYLNELWLAPLGIGTTFNLLRGLAVLSIPLAAAGGFFLAERPRAGPWLVAVGALWTLCCLATAIPRSCHVREIALGELRDLQVERCTFRWRGPAVERIRRERSDAIH